MEAVYLVCYDIADPKRLRQVHKTTQDRGERLQLSVYQCLLTPMQLVTFRSDLDKVIVPGEDQVLFIRIGPRTAATYDKIDSLGRAYRPPEHRSYVV